MSYEAGFDAGERQAFADRQTGERMHQPEAVGGSWVRGFWDGYCPRSAEWATSLRRVEGDESECLP